MLTLSMAQLRLTESLEENEKKALDYCDRAKDSDLLFFPEIQYSPFFPQFPQYNTTPYLLTADSPQVKRLQAKAKEHHFYLSPNLYLEFPDGKHYDSSLWIDPEGSLLDIATMVHIFNAPKFYERNYYSPSPDGFKVFATPFGKIGIVICFDRHLPESVRTCAAMGADLVLIPTANMEEEPLDLFQYEIQVLSMQNRVFIAMCNRVGPEGDSVFAGQSLITHPSGEVILKADGSEQLITAQLDLSEAAVWKNKFPFLGLRRPEMYR